MVCMALRVHAQLLACDLGTATTRLCARKGLYPQRNDLHDRHGFPPVDVQPPLRVSALSRPTHERWAACAGRSPDSRLWRSLQPSRWSQDLQWHLWSELAAYSCGGSLGVGARCASPCSHFCRSRSVRERDRHAANRRNLRSPVNGPLCRETDATMQVKQSPDDRSNNGRQPTR